MSQNSLFYFKTVIKMNKYSSKDIKVFPTEFMIPVNPSPERICKVNTQRSPAVNVVKRMTQDIQRRKYIKEASHACSSMTTKKSYKSRTDVYDRLIEDANSRTSRKVKLNDFLLTQSKIAPKFSVEDTQVYERLFKDSQVRSERKNYNEKIKLAKEKKVNEKTLTSGIFQRILESSQETLRRGLLRSKHSNLLTVPQQTDRKRIISVLKSEEGSNCEEATSELLNEDELIERLYGIKPS